MSKHDYPDYPKKLGPWPIGSRICEGCNTRRTVDEYEHNDKALEYVFCGTCRVHGASEKTRKKEAL